MIAYFVGCHKDNYSPVSLVLQAISDEHPAIQGGFCSTKRLHLASPSSSFLAKMVKGIICRLIDPFSPSQKSKQSF